MKKISNIAIIEMTQQKTVVFRNHGAVKSSVLQNKLFQIKASCMCDVVIANHRPISGDESMTEDHKVLGARQLPTVRTTGRKQRQSRRKGGRYDESVTERHRMKREVFRERRRRWCWAYPLLPWDEDAA